MGPVLGRLVSSTFDKKRMTPHSEFSPGTIKLLLRYYFFYQSRPILRLECEAGTRYFLGKVLEMFTI